MHEMKDVFIHKRSIFKIQESKVISINNSSIYKNWSIFSINT